MPITPEAIMSQALAFMGSRVLLTATELDVFTRLAKEPLTAPELAGELVATPRGIAALLDALVPMGFLVKEQEKYRCPADVAAFLSQDSPRSLLPIVQHGARGWKRWSNLTEIVRHGRKSEPTTSYDQTSHDQENFINGMHVIAARLAPAIVAATGTKSATRLLDIGGATGTYAQAFLEASPDMTATLFDLPPVIEIARKRLAATAVMDRITFVTGDFYHDELPEGHDLAFISAIIHQNSPEQNVELYRKAFRALTPGGRLVIRDHIMNAEHTSPASGTLFAVNMLIGTMGGGTYSFGEIKATLEEAGFVGIALIQPDERMTGLIEAFKP